MMVIMRVWTLATVCSMLLGETARAQVESFELKNGIRVYLNTIPEASDVAMETSYDIGFIDEPAGMVQASHLLEHLVCYSGGGGFEMFEAMQWLNRVGSGNAETLPDFTHYDYVVPAKEFEKVLQIEAARMRGASFDRELIERECKRVYQETDFVERNPASGMLKHAMMACSHAWRYQSEKALVRGGMEEFEVEALAEFYREFYDPRRLTVAITGSISLNDAKRMLAKHLQPITSDRALTETQIDWSRVPKKQTIQWDASPRAVCIAWQAPKDRAEQVVLSLCSALAMQSLMQDANLKEQCHIAFCTNNTWSCVDLPVFAYASIKEDVDAAEVQSQLNARFTEAIQGRAAMGLMQAKALCRQFQTQQLTWTQAQSMQKILMRQGRLETQAIQLVLLQDALNRVIADRLYGSDPEALLEALESMSPQSVTALIDQTVNEENLRTVMIVPE